MFLGRNYATNCLLDFLFACCFAIVGLWLGVDDFYYDLWYYLMRCHAFKSIILNVISLFWFFFMYLVISWFRLQKIPYFPEMVLIFMLTNISALHKSVCSDSLLFLLRLNIGRVPFCFCFSTAVELKFSFNAMQAILGGSVDVPTLSGKKQLTVRYLLPFLIWHFCYVSIQDTSSLF